jgi:hypothetical protein
MYRDRYNINDSTPGTLRFPSLHTLEFHIDPASGLPWLLDTEAPRLSNLIIIDPSQRELRVAKGAFYHAFETEKRRIKIAPTLLELGVKLCVTSTLHVLKHWSQIQDLTLYWDQKFIWHGKLMRGLCNTNTDGKAICPDLHVLRIVMWSAWSQEVMDAWLGAAHRILRARKDVLPLWKITLSDRSKLPASHSVTIFDID